ncbi:hypothetical protein [Rothia sp. HMSC072B04]|nr:hypothetical protein [Rothia sp. HMSC072B04]
MTDFNSLIAEFGRQVRENLRVGEGEPEAQLTNPVAGLWRFAFDEGCDRP